ncbi:hypothetical protein [Natronorubrum sp. FCH18a]|uniref:hypothetical protein n=1 Tax=Natronorubrum sp. FCH18a TaxID=3447018 RepID=UPI003F519656
MIEGKVADILNEYEIVANVGEEDGVEEGMEFIVYSVGDVIEDPDTGEALGNVEHVKAKVQAKHVQESITVMKSAETIKKKTGLAHVTSSGTKRVTREIAEGPEEKEDDKVRKGDLIRQNISE